MGRFIAISLLVCWSIALRAQFASRADVSIGVHVQFAAVDKLEQVYIINPENEVLKYNAAGKLLYKYTNNYLGAPLLIDVSNPIQVMVYYPGLQTIVTLDVTLNEIARTNLVSFGFFDIKRVCTANDGQIWILDGLDFKLKKIDRYGNVLKSSEDMLLRLGRNFAPVAMFERQNSVLVLDENLGLLIFDNLGNYVRTEPFIQAKTAMAFAGKLFYMDADTAYSWDMDSNARWPVKLPETSNSGLQSFSILPNAFFGFYPDRFEVYQLRD